MKRFKAFVFFSLVYACVLGTMGLCFVARGGVCESLFRLKPSFLQKTVEVGVSKKVASFVDIESFTEAMTHNLLLSKQQSDLFDLYITYSFPYSRAVDYSLQSVLDILEKHPRLSKLEVREQIIHLPVREYLVPKQLTDFIRSFKKTSHQVRSSFFQIEANYGFWVKLLDFSVISVKEEASSANKNDKQKGKSNKIKDSFIKYLNTTALDRATRDKIKNPDYDYKKQTIILYRALDEIRRSFFSPHASFRSLRTANKIGKVMAELVHTVGFGNKHLSSMLNNKDPLNSIQVMQKMLYEREVMAHKLGFKDFLKLTRHLDVRMPDIGNTLDNIMNQDFYSHERVETFRLRPLSVQESPFRSCLSGDCASHFYFEKALDPNYLYFTLTDKKHKSAGHVAVVLGTTKKNIFTSVRTAFVDKIQGFEMHYIPVILEGIRLSLKEKGYKLALPVQVGSGTGISSEAHIRSYMEHEILSHLKNKLVHFRAFHSGYVARIGYSRVNDNLDLLEVEGMDLHGATVQKGEISPIQYAHKALSVVSLYKPILLLRHSKNEEDQMQFLSHLLKMLNIRGLNISTEDAHHHLHSVLQDKSFSFRVRKQAFFNLLQLALEEVQEYYYPSRLFSVIKNISFFSAEEVKTLVGEMSNWKNTTDYRKTFIKYLTKESISSFDLEKIKFIIHSPWGMILDVNDILLASAKEGALSIMQEILEKGADINSKNSINGGTPLIHATQQGHLKIVHFLIEKGADVHITDYHKRSALDWALQEKHTDIAILLQKAGRVL